MENIPPAQIIAIAAAIGIRAYFQWPFILKCVGFGVKGIFAKSLAALIQSWFGNVPAGGWFAYLTHLAMI